MHVYNPDTDSWVRVDTVVKPKRSLFSSVVLDDKIYAIGGLTYSRQLSSVEAYDPVNNIWETHADIPYALSGHASAIVNQQIYVLGGSTDGKVSDEVLKFSPGD